MSCSDEQEEAEHYQDVVHSFRIYSVDMLMELARREQAMTKDLVDLLPGGREGFRAVIDATRSCIAGNQQVFNQALQAVGEPLEREWKCDVATEIRNLSKVRSTLHQCAREWSVEGKEERDKCFQPLLKHLREFVPIEKDAATNAQVLVPGAGLGRLCAEIVRLGYDCQGNEFSYQMLIMSGYILNDLKQSNQVTVYPWIHNPSNTINTSDLTRPVTIPDESASEMLDQHSGQMSMCAGEFVLVYQDQLNTWDAIVTCFFIDTAPNLLEYIKVIHNALKPGGAWINGGPLLWHWQSNGPRGSAANHSHDDVRYGKSVELSYEQVKHVISQSGFEIKHESFTDCGYTSNPKSMLKSVYTIVHFVAIKV